MGQGQARHSPAFRPRRFRGRSGRGKIGRAMLVYVSFLFLLFFIFLLRRSRLLVRCFVALFGGVFLVSVTLSLSGLNLPFPLWCTFVWLVQIVHFVHFVHTFVHPVVFNSLGSFFCGSSAVNSRVCSLGIPVALGRLERCESGHVGRDGRLVPWINDPWNIQRKAKTRCAIPDVGPPCVECQFVLLLLLLLLFTPSSLPLPHVVLGLSSLRLIHFYTFAMH